MSKEVFGPAIRGKAFSCIPELTSEEVRDGIEYSFIMFKPEAIETLERDAELKEGFMKKIFGAISILDLEVVADKIGTFSLGVFQVIYGKEIASQIIPDWEVERFSKSRTRFITVKGADSKVKTSLIKGKFICPENCIYDKSGISSSILKEIFGRTGCEIGDRKWGSGCGVRGYLAALEILKPDPGETDYTVYNWIHSPDVDQDDVINFVIETINN